MPNTSMFSKTVKVLCAGCGKTFYSRLDRFPICGCGHTVPIISDSPYAEINRQKDTVMVIRGERVESIPLQDEKKVIRTIYVLPFMNEDQVKNEMMKEFSGYEDLLYDFSASDLLLHKLYYKYSDIYRAFFEKAEIKKARSIFEGRMFLSFVDKAQKYNTISDGGYIRSDETDLKGTFTAIMCRLNDFPVQYRDTLVNAELTVDQFENLKKDTVFTEDEIIKYLGELQSISVRSEEAIEYIKEYSFYSSELKTWFGRDRDPIAPIYTGCHLMKTTYTMYKNSGLLAYRKYLSKFNNVNDSFDFGTYTVRLLGSEEVRSVPMGTLPNKDVTAPLIGVYNINNDLIALIANCEGKILMKGDQSDGVKIAVNNYLDERNGTGR